MLCPPCKGSGKSPSTRTSQCLCCKGKKEITQKHFDVLQRISKDIQAKLNQ
jgi:DnaJ-class molecular chaperone